MLAPPSESTLMRATSFLFTFSCSELMWLLGGL